MRAWGLGALLLLAIFIAGCGSNSTPVAVAVSTTVSNLVSVTPTSVTLLVNTSAQFIASVTGASATTVFWQLCKTAPTSTTQPATDCTQGVGPAQCTIPKVSSPFTGASLGTMTPNGLYTAPGSAPQPNKVYVMATSCVDSSAFGTFIVIVDSGIRVHISPASATIGTGQTFQFVATVTPAGTANPAVSWSLCQSGANGLTCGVNGIGSISSSGLYQAPNVPASLLVQAISAADQNQSATSSVSVVAEAAPAVTKLDPSTVAQGSVQQDVYVTGTDLFSTDTVLVGGVALPSANVVYLGATLLRVTVPGAQLANAGTIPVVVQDQAGNQSAPVNLTVVAVRPAVVGSAPDSVAQNPGSSPTVILTGGFFSPNATTATLNGQAVSATVNSSRQLSLAIPTGALGTPGLFPIVVTNAGVASGPSTSALNVGVTPAPSSIGTSPLSSVGVGSSPSAVAIDEADGFAVVANTVDGTISLIALAPPSPKNIATIAVGNQPTGVAVDDLLPDPIALVVNSADQTVSAIDLKTESPVGKALSVSIGPENTSPIPLSIGINPITHRAVVAYQSTNQATVLDLSSGTPKVVQQVGGGTVSFGTGANPAVAIDPRLNWAVVTPGGSGEINLVDLGFNASAGQPAGRAPQVVGSVAIATTVQGIGINSETHEAFLSDPQTGELTTFSLLDYTVNTVLNTANGTAFSQKGFGAAAASALENVGIAVSNASTAVIVDLQNDTVLQTVTGLGSSPNVQAVAVDAVSNQAVVVNQGANSVSIVSLGSSISPLQIVEAGPAIVFGGTGAGNAQLTINGSGFVGGSSQVLLDGVALPAADVNVVSTRQIIATVPGMMLTVPRRYAVQVENPGGVFSNVTDLAVIQAVPVGKGPVGVAIDTDRDLAVVTNFTDGTVSLVALTPQTPVGPTQTPAGSIGVVGGGPITVGTAPEGVAVIPRLGRALVANNGSNNETVVDVTQTVVPVTAPQCAGCVGPAGVTIDQDTATGLVANTNPSASPTATGTMSFVGMAAAAPTVTSSPNIDQNPVAVAVDPNPLFPYAAVATDSSTSAIDFLDTTNGGAIVGRAFNLEDPTDIIFDPVNQVFLTANSLMNQIVLIDPTTFLETPVRVGIGPTSLDYNYQASTLVTVNSISDTMSVLSYVCPPSAGAPACLGPQVRTVIGLGGGQVAPVFGPSAVAVDPILNLAVLVDADNNQVLLIPLPH